MWSLKAFRLITLKLLSLRNLRQYVISSSVNARNGTIELNTVFITKRRECSEIELPSGGISLHYTISRFSSCLFLIVWGISGNFGMF